MQFHCENGMPIPCSLFCDGKVDCPDGKDEVSCNKMLLKDVPGGFPKSDLLGVTVALIHVAAQR